MARAFYQRVVDDLCGNDLYFFHGLDEKILYTIPFRDSISFTAGQILNVGGRNFIYSADYKFHEEKPNAIT